MAAKTRKSVASLKKSDINVLPRRASSIHSARDQFTINEGEFSYLFRKHCLECNSKIVPNVKTMSVEADTDRLLSFSDGSGSSITRKKSVTDNKVFPEVLVVEDETSIVKVVFKNFQVNKNMLVALVKTLKMEFTLRILKLEFCNLTSKEIHVLQLLLQKNPTITELSINGNPNKVQNHHLLLQQAHLIHLSMRFCQINQHGASKIADELKFAFGQSLSHLNLSSNFLYDEGAQYMADFLRVNRNLVGLNLADNFITDKGCMALMEVLQKFPLRHDEIVLRRNRILSYCARRNELIQMHSKAFLPSTHTISKSTIGKSSSQTVKRKGGTSDRSSVKSSGSRIKKPPSKNMSQLESIISSNLGTDYHPFVKDSYSENKEIYCNGNDVLQSLNLAYNKITMVGLRYIARMLKYQTSNFPEAAGITRMVLEGNTIANCSCSMNDINDILAQKNNKRQGSIYDDSTSRGSRPRSSMASLK